MSITLTPTATTRLDSGDLEALFDRVHRTWSNAQRANAAHTVDLVKSVRAFGGWQRRGLPTVTGSGDFAMYKTTVTHGPGGALDRYAVVHLPTDRYSPTTTAEQMVELFRRATTSLTMAGDFLALWNWVLTLEGDMTDVLRLLWREVTHRPQGEQFLVLLDLLPRTEAAVVADRAQYITPAWTTRQAVLDEAFASVLRPRSGAREEADGWALQAVEAWLGTIPASGVAADFLDGHDELSMVLEARYRDFLAEQMRFDPSCRRRAPMVLPPVPAWVSHGVAVSLAAR